MDIMTLEDVCKLLKITEQTARNRLSLRLPMPPSFKIGRRRLFLVSQVKKWLCQQAGIDSGNDTKNSDSAANPTKRGRPRKSGGFKGTL